MKLTRLFTLGALGLGVMAGTAFAQNIQTNTTSTTVGSPSFGFAITAAQLQTVMQSTVAPTCGARGADGVMNCTLADYAKAPGMPGSFTGNPFKVVWATADFGCGLVCGTNGGADPQTAPVGATVNTLTGTITSTVDLGIGTATGDPFHLAGHITFTMNPATMNAHIDQVVTQEINDATGLRMAFTETDATSAAGFTASTDPSIFTFTGPVNLTTGMALTQSGAPPGGNFVSNVTVPFTYGAPFILSPTGFTGSAFPLPDAFTTPGLNTGGANPDAFPHLF